MDPTLARGVPVHALSVQPTRHEVSQHAAIVVKLLNLSYEPLYSLSRFVEKSLVVFVAGDHEVSFYVVRVPGRGGGERDAT